MHIAASSSIDPDPHMGSRTVKPCLIFDALTIEWQIVDLKVMCDM